MNVADLHLRYDRERRADLVREATAHDLAALVARARARERRAALVGRGARIAQRSPLADR